MLEAIFTSGINEIKVSGLTQWDRGQVIAVTCPDITELFQVHFAFKGGTEALVVTAADTEFAIPDELLMQSRDLIAYVYALGSDGSGETVKTIHLPVTPRAKPEDYTSDLTPSQMEQVEAMLAEFYEDATAKANNAVEIANAAKDAADGLVITGFYNGDGNDATKRTITLDTNSNLLFIWCEGHGYAFVSPVGAIVIGGAGECEYVGPEEAQFVSGTYSYQTTNYFLNDAGAVYNYQGL